VTFLTWHSLFVPLEYIDPHDPHSKSARRFCGNESAMARVARGESRFCERRVAGLQQENQRLAARFVRGRRGGSAVLWLGGQQGRQGGRNPFQVVLRAAQSEKWLVTPEQRTRGAVARGRVDDASGFGED
jgi:hypothetical protein